MDALLCGAVPGGDRRPTFRTGRPWHQGISNHYHAIRRPVRQQFSVFINFSRALPETVREVALVRVRAAVLED